jgi:hypothetical protein
MSTVAFIPLLGTTTWMLTEYSKNESFNMYHIFTAEEQQQSLQNGLEMLRRAGSQKAMNND